MYLAMNGELVANSPLTVIDAVSSFTQREKSVSIITESVDAMRPSKEDKENHNLVLDCLVCENEKLILQLKTIATHN